MSIELDPSKEWGMVAYTDGGARPNPGASGCGMHSYIYEIPERTSQELTVDQINGRVRYLLTSNPELKPLITGLNKSTLVDALYARKYFIDPIPAKPIKFTDGEAIRYAFMTDTGYHYCSKDGDPSSAIHKHAASVVAKYIVTAIQSSSNQHTNNYAEMQSFKNAVKLARLHKVKRLHIITDSEYTLKGINVWVPGWIQRNWITSQGEPVKNREHWEALYKEYQGATKEDGITVTTSWVKGHRNHPGNFHADHLATIGVMRSMKAIDQLDVRYYTPKEYQEPKRERTPLLSLKRMYFNRVEDRNAPGTYYMADPGKDDALIGKPLPETVFAVVRLKEPDPIVQAIWDAQARYGQEFNATMMLKMDDVYEPYAYHLVSEYQDKALLKAPKGSHVVLPDGRQMSIERNPIGITMRAIDSLNSLENILDIFTELRKETPDPLVNTIGLQIHDLTEELYDLSEKKVQGETQIKKTMKKDIVVGQKTFSITRDVDMSKETKTITFPLRLGADMPDRNSLKRLETSDPVVSLITWRESSNSLRYAAVLECDEGIAIWSNYYADRLMFKEG